MTASEVLWLIVLFRVTESAIDRPLRAALGWVGKRLKGRFHR